MHKYPMTVPKYNIYDVAEIITPQTFKGEGDISHMYFMYRENAKYGKFKIMSMRTFLENNKDTPDMKTKSKYYKKTIAEICNNRHEELTTFLTNIHKLKLNPYATIKLLKDFYMSQTEAALSKIEDLNKIYKCMSVANSTFLYYYKIIFWFTSQQYTETLNQCIYKYKADIWEYDTLKEWKKLNELFGDDRGYGAYVLFPELQKGDSLYN